MVYVRETKKYTHISGTEGTADVKVWGVYGGSLRFTKQVSTYVRLHLCPDIGRSVDPYTIPSLDFESKYPTV